MLAVNECAVTPPSRSIRKKYILSHSYIMLLFSDVAIVVVDMRLAVIVWVQQSTGDI